MPLTAFEFAVAVLCAYRITRLVAVDGVLETPRTHVLLWCERGGWARRKLGQVLECPYCAGVYLSCITYVTVMGTLGRWSKVPVLAHVIMILAIAGGQALLSAVDSKLQY